MRNLFKGERLILTAIRESDMAIIEKWMNDVHFLRHYDMLAAVPQTDHQTKKGILEMAESSNGYLFAIRKREEEELLGITGLIDIQWTNQVGTFFIGIGHTVDAGKGYGLEALLLMLDFAFNELNLYRVQLNVISYNERAIRLYEKAGFRREGVFRELLQRDNQRFDLYLYGLLRSEWYEIHPLADH